MVARNLDSRNRGFAIMRFTDGELDDIAAYHGWIAVTEMGDGALFSQASSGGKWSVVTWTQIIKALQS